MDRSEVRSAADLAFLIGTSEMSRDCLVCGQASEAAADPRPGDVLREGWRLSVPPAADEVAAAHVREVVAEVKGRAHYAVSTEVVEERRMPFEEFAQTDLFDDALRVWGDGDPDSSQVGAFECGEEDGCAVLRADVAVQRRGWPRRPRGSWHDELEVAVDAAGRVDVALSEAGHVRSVSCKASELIELYELGRLCRAAGVRVEGGELHVPLAAGDSL